MAGLVAAVAVHGAGERHQQFLLPGAGRDGQEDAHVGQHRRRDAAGAGQRRARHLLVAGWHPAGPRRAGLRRTLR